MRTGEKTTIMPHTQWALGSPIMSPLSSWVLKMGVGKVKSMLGIGKI